MDFLCSSIVCVAQANNGSQSGQGRVKQFRFGAQENFAFVAAVRQSRRLGEIPQLPTSAGKRDLTDLTNGEPRPTPGRCLTLERVL